MNIYGNPSTRKFGYTPDGDRVPLDRNGKSRVSYNADGDASLNTWSGHRTEKVYNVDGDVVSIRAIGNPEDIIW